MSFPAPVPEALKLSRPQEQVCTKAQMPLDHCYPHAQCMHQQHSHTACLLTAVHLRRRPTALARSLCLPSSSQLPCPASPKRRRSELPSQSLLQSCPASLQSLQSLQRLQSPSQRSSSPLHKPQHSLCIPVGESCHLWSQFKRGPVSVTNPSGRTGSFQCAGSACKVRLCCALSAAPSA